MRHLQFLLIAAISGCASGDDPPATIDGGSDAGANDVGRDTGTPLPTDAAMDAIFAVDDTGPTGVCATPAGTTVTANGAYMSAAEYAVDGNLGTVWNSGDYSGWIRLKFPSPTRVDRIRIAANALPACDETFTVKSPTATLATETRAVSGESKWLPEITVPAASYDELLIEIGPALSWIALNEIVVFDSTGGCPPP